MRRAAVILCVVMSAAAARAYVRTTSTHSGAPVAWLESCVVVQPDARGSVDVPMPAIEDTLARAASNWSSRTATCSWMALTTAPPNGVVDVGSDGRQVVVFRHDKWQRPGGMPHDPSAIGITTVFYLDTPGVAGDATIFDADIELNGVNYTFTTDPANGSARPGTGIADLENTLTHELGHVQGLAHNCWDHVSDSPPLDDQGNPAPDCNGALSQAIVDATMYPYASTVGETSKRDITDDDQRGICETYPASAATPACRPRVQGGCAIGAGAGTGAGASASAVPRSSLLALGVLVGGVAVARRVRAARRARARRVRA
jgi:hypothetical protein